MKKRSDLTSGHRPQLFAAVASGALLLLPAPARAQDEAAPAAGAPAPMQATEAGPPARARRIVMESMDEIHLLRTAIRRVTTVSLPPDEELLQTWSGDTEYWAIRGAGNLVFIKPSSTGLRTNAALTCQSGRVYHFELVAVDPDSPSDLAVQVERADRIDSGARPVPPDGFGLPDVRFVPATAVTEYAANAQAAWESLSDLQAEVPGMIAAEAERVRRVQAAEMRFEYRLQESLTQPPFSVRGMWHDGTFTYIRSAALETPAIYVAGEDGSPLLVDYDLESHGLYIVREVLGDGWMQVGAKRGRWIREITQSPAEELLRARGE